MCQPCRWLRVFLSSVMAVSRDPATPRVMAGGDGVSGKRPPSGPHCTRRRLHLRRQNVVSGR